MTRIYSICFLGLWISGSAFGQVIIDKGGLYTSLQYKQTVQIHTQEQVVFDGCHFQTSKTAIEAYHPEGANLEIRNCTFTGQNPNLAGKTQGRTVHLNGHGKSMVFRFEHNTGTGFRGIWLQNMAYGAEIRIGCNQWENIQGRVSDGNGGYTHEADPNSENSQFLLMTEITGADVEIAWNHIRQDAYASKVEDVINLFACKGRSKQPIRISHNLIDGAYAANPGYEKAYSGTGIQIEHGSAYVEISNNTLINTSNAGLALSWARKCTVFQNTIISTGELPYDEGSICQSWRGLLIGNPFWHPEKTRENEAYGNTVWFAENDVPGEDCTVKSKKLAPIECLPGNYCHDNLIPEGLPQVSDEEAARTAWQQAAAASDRVPGN